MPRVTIRLRIVGVNDVYSLAALPRLATLVAAMRVEDAPDRVLVTVAGDFLAPSLLSSLDGGRGMADCFRALGVTHVTLGNHEDDLELGDLRARLEELGAVVLLTNVHGAELASVPSDVVTIAGARVGLVGVVNGDRTLFRRPPFGGADFEDTNGAATREAATLRATGCVAVVALTHQPLPRDRALADLGVVDLVLGGHEHEGTLETTHRAPLAKAPMNATAAIVADVTIEGAHVSVSVRLVPTAGHAEDEAMRARVDRHLAQVHALEARTVAMLPEGVVLASDGARAGQTSFGTFVCSHLRDGLGAEAALFNGGGLRGSSAHRGRLTYADLREELPFDNEIVVARVPGAVVRDAIRFARTELRGTGGFLQVDDAADVDDTGELRALAGAPLELERIYRVAIVRELFFGLDHVEPLLAFARAHPSSIPPATTGNEVKVALLRTLVTHA